MRLRFKKLHELAFLPAYSKKGDAGLDLTVTEIQYKNQYIEYKFGLAVEIPEGYLGLMIPRSSITNKNLMMKNSVGLIDSGFRGELVLRCKRTEFVDGTATELFKEGERAAQLVVLPYPVMKPIFAENLASSARGVGGFGSSGL